MTRKSQTNDEKSIFLKFVLCANKILQIIKQTIKVSEPPKPDICCKLADGRTIFFEIAQSIDSSLSLNCNLSIKLTHEIYRNFNLLQHQSLKIIKTKFKHHFISIKLFNKITKNKAISSFNEIFDWLVKYNIKSNNSINSRVVEEISITKSSINGPIFNFDTCISFDDPIIKTIEKKFQKKYSTNYPIFLLIYYSKEFDISAAIKLKEIDDFVKKNIINSQFSEIWVYSEEQNKILYHYRQNDARAYSTHSRSGQPLPAH
jgi:hypothetical protein